MLQVVADHADQPDAEGHRRVPAPVDDAVEVVVGQAAQELGGPPVHGGVVAEQQLGSVTCGPAPTSSVLKP